MLTARVKRKGVNKISILWFTHTKLKWGLPKNLENVSTIDLKNNLALPTLAFSSSNQLGSLPYSAIVRSRLLLPGGQFVISAWVFLPIQPLASLDKN